MNHYPRTKAALYTIKWRDKELSIRASDHVVAIKHFRNMYLKAITGIKITKH